MQCPNRGTWQAYLDFEINEKDRQRLEDHVADCLLCQNTLEELQQLDQWSYQCLTGYQEKIQEQISENIQVSQITNLMLEPKKSLIRRDMWMSKRIKKWVAVAASVTVLTGLMTFSPVQQAVADFLSIFRVQQIQTVQINPDDLQQMARAIETKVGEIDLQQFGKVEVNKKQELVKLSVDQAKNQLPFTLKQPAYLPAGLMMADKVSLHSEGQAEFQLNVAQANSLLKRLGSQTLLPASLDGKAFSVLLPAGVQLEYLNGEGERVFRLTQFSSPELTVPEGVDPRDLRSALLDLPILPSDLRSQLASIEDWQNTMIIPDTGEGDMEKLTINGKEAIYGEYKSGWSNLFWVDQGVIFQLNGNLQREEIIKIAESLS